MTNYVIKVEGLYIASIIGGPQLDMTYTETQAKALKLPRDATVALLPMIRRWGHNGRARLVKVGQ